MTGLYMMLVDYITIRMLLACVLAGILGALLATWTPTKGENE